MVRAAVSVEVLRAHTVTVSVSPGTHRRSASNSGRSMREDHWRPSRLTWSWSAWASGRAGRGQSHQAQHDHHRKGRPGPEPHGVIPVPSARRGVRRRWRAVETNIHPAYPTRTALTA